MNDDDLECLAADIAAADATVALTGAGISAPSGVPTFRGDDGVWERFDEGQFTYGRFRRDPAGFWRDRLELHRELFGEEYEPNAAHEALAELARDGYLDAIVTQNTDGLHLEATERVAGSNGDAEAGTGGSATSSETDADVLELHGNAHRVVCTDCGRRVDAETAFDRVESGDIPPECECGGVFKPDVVLFGQQLPGAALQRARTLARESDVYLAIGSSLVVEPAASLPRLAARTGATVAIVTLEETPRDDEARFVFRADVTDVLPRLRSAIAEAGAGTEPDSGTDARS